MNGVTMKDSQAPSLRARRIGLLTQDEPIVLMRSDCHVCRSEGLASRARVMLTSASGVEIIATLYQIDNDWLELDEAGVSENIWRRLALKPGEAIFARHPPQLDSLADVRARMYGARLGAAAFAGILRDIVHGRYADIHLAAFIAACSAFPLDLDEIKHLTGAMVDVGDRLSWPSPLVLDKHCVGGLAGNRTTPIVVAVAASLGLTIPKTSSRAITSPSGTADTMETLAPVDLDIAQMRRVVEREGGCIAWGGAVRLSPADDTLIRIERALDIDTEGQLIASVLSKKIAAGATHLALDLPIGPTAKVRTRAAGEALADRLSAIAAAFGLKTRCVLSDGTQPVGRGIGPALEAHDVLAVLQGRAGAPADLRARAIEVTGAALELAGRAAPQQGAGLAAQTIDDGSAWAKFQRICEAQGGMRQPGRAAQTHVWAAPRAGRITAIDNRKISRLAKLAGAPEAKAAGVEMHEKLGAVVEAGQPLATIHAEARGELEYALEYAISHADMFTLED